MCGPYNFDFANFLQLIVNDKLLLKHIHYCIYYNRQNVPGYKIIIFVCVFLHSLVSFSLCSVNAEKGN